MLLNITNRTHVATTPRPGHPRGPFLWGPGCCSFSELENIQNQIEQNEQFKKYQPQTLSQKQKTDKISVRNIGEQSTS